MDTAAAAEVAVTATGQQFDDESYTCGLNYARSLNFTDEQYEEALKRISRPDNANQLLVALIDVSSQQQTSKRPLVGDTLESHLLGDNHNHQHNQNNQDNLLLAEVENKSTSTCRMSDYCPLPAADSSSCCSLTNSTTISSSFSSSCSSGISTSGCHSCHPTRVMAEEARESSFTSPSTTNQSLESLSQHSSSSRTPLTRTSSSTSSCSTNGSGGGELKKIYVDGSNVAMTHGKDVTFSWPGIMLCVEWFRARQHHVRVLVPDNRCTTDAHNQVRVDSDQLAIIRHLDELGVLVRTPSGHNDDLMILEAAHKNQGIIVSNDQYRDERRRTRAFTTNTTTTTTTTTGDETTTLDQFVNSSRLAYVFVDDLFIPAADPHGRNGPSLSEFLRNEPSQSASNGKSGSCLSRQHPKLGKTRSHQITRQSGGAANSRNNYSRGYNSVYRQPQHSIHTTHTGNPQPDYTSSRQIHSWQGPARPSLEPAFDRKQYTAVARGPCFVHPAGADHARQQQQQHQQSPSSKHDSQTSIWPAFLRR